MAAVGAALMGKVLGHSEAEKAFRPWWDSLEDYLIYGLVMIGVVMVPTAIISGTPLDCNYCLIRCYQDYSDYWLGVGWELSDSCLICGGFHLEYDW